MKILVISNLYPPHFMGGYELICADVVSGLRDRGHRVTVLTSSRGLLRSRQSANTIRLLKTGIYFEQCSNMRKFVENIWNCLTVQIVAKIFKPEIIYVFNLGGLGELILGWLHSQPIAVVHDIIDAVINNSYQSNICFKISSKDIKSPFERFISFIIINLFPFIKTKLVPIDLSKSCFRSHFLKRQLRDLGGDISEAPVIYPGIRLREPKFGEETPRNLGIVFSGRLSPEKGVHVLLEALLLIKHFLSELGVKITIMGPITFPDYWQRLRNLANDLAPGLSVNFTKLIPQREAIKLLKEHTIFAFPVLWDEPFGLAPLEAMGAGLAVIATCTGGSAEFLKDGGNCLAVPKGDARALAEALKRLLSDEGLRLRLVKAGQETAANFAFEKSLDLIEKHLLSLSSKA